MCSAVSYSIGAHSNARRELEIETKSKLISAWNTKTAWKRSSKQSQNQTDEVGTLLGRESFGFPFASYYPVVWSVSHP